MIASHNTAYIEQVMTSFTRDNAKLLESVMQLIYYYRGALSRDDALAMSPLEREMAVEFLNNRFKEAGDLIKKQIPVFL